MFFFLKTIGIRKQRHSKGESRLSYNNVFSYGALVYERIPK